MAIARAIAERDPDRAAAAMQAHLAEVQRLIVERMSPVLLDAGSAAG
jgi:DNA-binding FadR family transcriptional regulator